MTDDDLLGDFGDNFNILEFADALDGNDSSKTNILDDLEGEEGVDVKAGEGVVNPPPYTGNQFPAGAGGRGPPPPYPGPGQPPKVGNSYFDIVTHRQALLFLSCRQFAMKSGCV